jgi:hypothetical protein
MVAVAKALKTDAMEESYPRLVSIRPSSPAGLLCFVV